jgi:hypothetical protein
MAGNKYLAPNGGRHDEARAAQLSSDGATAAGALVALNSNAKVDSSLLPITKGNATLAAGTVTVTNSAAATGMVILLSYKTPGATVGVLSVGTIVNGTSFVINSSYDGDTGVVSWVILG